MKRNIVLFALLCAVMLLLCACGAGPADSTGGDTSADYTGTFRVGFGRVNITPELGIGLAGMGDDATRKATTVESQLYMTCIAVTDEQENTVLLMTSDSIRTQTWVSDSIRDKASALLNVPREHIFSSTTHTHNAPDTVAAGYTNKYINAGVEACQKAMEDRKPAEIYTGTTNAPGLNFIRHYVMDDRSIVSPGYGDTEGKAYVKHTTEVDDELQLIKFARKDGKDIVLVNFRGHPIVQSPYTAISAGFLGHCRSEIEKQLKCHAAYFQGASGNVGDVSEIKKEMAFRGFKEQGKMLAKIAIDYMPSLKKVESGPVEVRTVSYKGNIRTDTEEYIQACKLFSGVIGGGGTKAQAIAASGGLCKDSRSLQYIYERQSLYVSGKGKMALEMGAVSIGDVAFISSPWEMFDNTGKSIKDNSPYEQTFVMYLCNGRGKYLPSEPAFTYGCYEKELSYFVKGTAEEVATVYVDMLKDLHADGIFSSAITEFDSKLPDVH